MKITHASRLSDSALVTEVTRLARGEREATVALIVHLAEFDARRLFEGAGFSSTFKYCMEVLRLSEDATFNRIEAARTARRFPVVLDMLIAGDLSPTTARMLARHLTTDNHKELLAAASGKSKHEVERLLAGRFPQPDVPSSVRKLPSATTADSATAPTATLAVSDPAAVVAAAPPPMPRPVVRPLAPERYEIRFTASAETCERLRRAQDLLGHAIPSGDLAQVFDRALALLIEDLERKSVRRLRSLARAVDSRRIRETSLRKYSARSRPETGVAALSSPPAAGAAARGASSSSITSARMACVGSRRRTTFSSAARSQPVRSRAVLWPGPPLRRR